MAAPTRWRLPVTRTRTVLEPWTPFSSSTEFSSQNPLSALLRTPTKMSSSHHRMKVLMDANTLALSSENWKLDSGNRGEQREAGSGAEVARLILFSWLDVRTEVQLARPKATSSHASRFCLALASWQSTVTVRFVWSRKRSNQKCRFYQFTFTSVGISICEPLNSPTISLQFSSLLACLLVCMCVMWAADTSHVVRGIRTWVTSGYVQMPYTFQDHLTLLCKESYDFILPAVLVPSGNAMLGENPAYENLQSCKKKKNLNLKIKNKKQQQKLNQLWFFFHFNCPH